MIEETEELREIIVNGVQEDSDIQIKKEVVRNFLIEQTDTIYTELMKLNPKPDVNSQR